MPATRRLEERHTLAALMNEYTKCLEVFDLYDETLHAATDAGPNMKRAASLANTDYQPCITHGLHSFVLADSLTVFQNLTHSRESADQW